MQTDTIIDLTTTRPRTVVKMDSGTYTFRNPFDLTPAETTRIESAMSRFLELTVKGRDRTTKESAELAMLSQEVCKIGLLEGDEKQAGPTGCVVLADFFFDLCLQTAIRLTAARGPMVEATTGLAGVTSSRASSGSTAARPARGSAKRR